MDSKPILKHYEYHRKIIVRILGSNANAKFVNGPYVVQVAAFLLLPRVKHYYVTKYIFALHATLKHF